MYCWVMKNDVPDIVEESTPSEMEKETTHWAEGGDVDALATKDSLAHTAGRKREKTKNNLDEGDTPGSTGTLAVSRSGRAALRRELW
jgi:hypothetical protein